MTQLADKLLNSHYFAQSACAGVRCYECPFFIDPDLGQIYHKIEDKKGEPCHCMMTAIRMRNMKLKEQ